MAVRDGRVRADDQLGAACGLVREVARRTGRKAGDPIEVPNRTMLTQVYQAEILANGQVSDARMRSHLQAAGENP